MNLTYDIHRYLQRSGMAPTSFGRAAVNDPRFVFDLRNGREAGPRVASRCYAFIAAREGRSGQCG